MSRKQSLLSFTLLSLALPNYAIGSVILTKRWNIITKVAVSALAAVGAVCTTGSTANCLITAISGVVITILSGFGNGAHGGTGVSLPTKRTMEAYQVRHYLPNGTTLNGFKSDLLELGLAHRITLNDDKWEAFASRISTGHVKITAALDQEPRSLSKRSTRWLRNGLTRRQTDDEPGSTSDIDVYYYDVNSGGDGTNNVGDFNDFANTAATDITNTFLNEQAETVCAFFDDPSGSEQVASEWYLRASDGTQGETPSGACDNAQGKSRR